MKQRFFFTALYLICSTALVFSQAEKATLILQGGEEIACQIKRVSLGYVYFEAATKSLVYKYGDFIEIEKIAAVRLSDGRTLTMNEYLTARGISQPVEEPPATQSRRKNQPESSPPNLPSARASRPSEAFEPSPSGPGMRLTNQLLDSAQTINPIGLRLPDLPPPSRANTELNYAELAGLLAEAGLVGKLLNEVNAGVWAGRELTKSQKELLEALAQSPIWMTRKNALREAHRVAAGEFSVLMQRQPDLLSREFRFQPASSKYAFEEFVQFLHVQNAVYFQDKWQPIETHFGEDAATAWRDILSNYDDWYFLFGEALEKR